MADPQQIIQSQTSIPDYARAQVERMLGATEGAIYDYRRDANGQLILDANGQPQVSGLKPYQTYQGQRIAGPDVLSQQAYQGIAGLGLGAEAGNSLQNMYNLAAQAGTSTYNPTAYGNQYSAPAAYQPGQFSYQGVGPQSAQYFQMQGPQMTAAEKMQAARLNAAPLGEFQTGTSAQLSKAPTAQAAQLITAPTSTGQTGAAARLRDAAMMEAAQADFTRLGEVPLYTGQQLDYTPQNIGFERVNALPLERFQMRSADNVGTGSFTQPGAANAFMSPYMQNVVDIQQREAQRQADIASTKRGAGFAQAGAFGGTRQAIENAEAARNLATQKGDIQATGLQSAYQQAQQQFNAEQQAGLQAALANQAVQQQTGVQNLSALLQTQGLSAQTGLTAQQLNQAAGIDTSKFNQGQLYNTALQNAQLLQQQQLANQGLQGQYGLTQGQMDQAIRLANANFQQGANVNNQSALNQFSLQQASMDQQAAMASLANQQQAAMANQALAGQFGLQQGSMEQQAALANQGLAGQFGLQQGSMDQQIAAANLANRQQTAMSNQALQGQYGLQQGQFNQAANAQNAQLAQQAALANQQAGLTVGQQNLAANLGVQQLYNNQAMQAQLANQQAGMTTQQQQEAANQYGYGQSMAAAANRAQYGQAANQLQEQANQYGAGYGLQALNAGMQGMQNYGNLSGLYNQQALNIANAQNQMGVQAQNYNQQQLTQNYNDFLNQQNFPFQQIGQLSNVLRGVPLSQQTQAVYQQAPSTASQLAGFGTAAVGAANLFAKAKGGMISQPRGLSSLILARMN